MWTKTLDERWAILEYDIEKGCLINGSIKASAKWRNVACPNLFVDGCN